MTFTLKKRTHYPTKTTLNLVVREKAAQKTKDLLLFFVAFLLFLGLFVHFAVLTPLDEYAMLETQVMDAQQQLNSLQQRAASYAEITAAYALYFPTDIDIFAPPTADMMEVLALLEAYLIPNSGVINASFAQNTLTVNLSRVTLEEAHYLLSILEQNPSIVTADMATANATTPQVANEEAIVSMYIVFPASEAMYMGGGAAEGGVVE